MLTIRESRKHVAAHANACVTSTDRLSKNPRQPRLVHSIKLDSGFGSKQYTRSCGVTEEDVDEVEDEEDGSSFP